MNRTEIKRAIGGSGSRLVIAEHDGRYWASNRYWLTDAERVRPLLEHAGFRTDAPAVYDVNGKITAADTPPPLVGPLMPTDESEQLALYRISGQLLSRPEDGRPAFVEMGNATCFVLVTVDHSAVYVNSDYLRFICDRYEVDAVTLRQQRKRTVSGGYEGPVEVYDPDGALLGLVMPVRG